MVLALLNDLAAIMIIGGEFGKRFPGSLYGGFDETAGNGMWV